MTQRTEQDFLGRCELPTDALYGIHSWRASQNFPDDRRFASHWYEAVGLVKKGCYLTYTSLKRAVAQHLPQSSFYREMINDELLAALTAAAGEVSAGEHFDQFIVPAVNGGAGTSINMNVNEIIANRALQMVGETPGTYSVIDPFDHANIYQSTNDVIPTALKLAAMSRFEVLEQAINALRFVIEEKERQYRNVVRTGYTQMQAAVPSSYGLLFSNYSDALSRDWWRVSRCQERLKVVNLGGSAIGTGMAVPRYFIMEVVQTLRGLTGLPLTRSENMSDTTSNLDSLVEVHAIIKALAVNLEKMSGDIRLLSSDLTRGEVSIPQRQVGSSVMPGKVNPVIAEYSISVAHTVYANDILITSLSGQGCLDLNPYIPVIGDALLSSLNLLIGACNTLKYNMIDGVEVKEGVAVEALYANPAVTTALVPAVGYSKATEVAKMMKTKSVNVFEAIDSMQLMHETSAQKILAPDELLKLGFSIKELYQDA